MTALAAAVTLALAGAPALAQDDGADPQSQNGDTAGQDAQPMPRGGMMGQGRKGPDGTMGPGMTGPGQGRGMMGPCRGMMGQGMMHQGMMGPGRGQGMHGPQGPGMRGQGGQGMMGPGQMYGGQMQGGQMQGGQMEPGMMRRHMMGGRGQDGPTLKVETPGGLTFTCNAGMQACLQAFEQVRAAGQAGAGGGQAN
jgi:hypothetical protein